jgi:LmbE family N-acetylglucosaminyl deacetylase
MGDVKHILVLSPHPDDDAIGCGGTIHHMAGEGAVAHIIYLTSGEHGGHGRSIEDTVRIREDEARRGAELLHAAHVEFWRQPDGALVVTEELVEKLKQRLATIRPAILFTPHDREDHPDHVATFELATRALMSLATNRPEVMMFEIWTPLQRMDRIVDISLSLDAKLAAVRAHKTQCEVLRFDDACRGLARYRGEMHSWPGGDYAEVFLEWRPPAPATSASSGGAA